MIDVLQRDAQKDRNLLDEIDDQRERISILERYPNDFDVSVSFLVAANNAADSTKNQADYLCDGTADDSEIQAAIDALPSAGGKVLLSEGTFTLASAVEIASDTAIIGQGYSTKIDQPAALQFAFTDDGAASPDDVLISGIRFVAAGSRSAEPVGIDLGVTGTAGNVIIRNCWFDDYVYGSGTPSGIRGKYDGLKVTDCIFTSANGTGNSYQIYLASAAEDVSILGCTFLTTFAGNCIYGYVVDKLRIVGNHFESTTLTPAIEGINLEGCSEATITGNTFYNLSIDGILMGGNATPGGCTDVVVSGNTFNGCGKTHASRRGAVSVGTAVACTKILILGNIANDCNAGVARIGESGQNIANEVLVTGNIVESCTNPAVLYGNNYDVQICDNWMRNNTNPISVATGTLKAYNNDADYVTENSGTATIDSGNTSEAVAHGLDAVPTVINIAFSEQGTNDYGRWWVDNIGATYFQLNVSSDPGASNLDFAWEAKVR